MTNIKILVLFCILTISQKSMSQMGPGIGMSSGSGFSNGYIGISTFFSVINVPITTMNIIQYNKKEKSNAGFGIVTGFAQIASGVIFRPDYGKDEFFVLNIGLGCVTILSSSLRLFKKESKKETMTSWNLYYVTMTSDKFGVGIKLTRKI